MTDGTLSKSDFAERIGVSAGRVSQYIAEGKLTSEALEGEGRMARIRPAIAIEQLKATLDPHQMLGDNGRAKLEIETSAPAVISSADADWLEKAIAARFDRARDDALSLLRTALRPGRRT
jgi:hypothetical protein